MTHFGERIRDLRKAQGLTQRQFAQQLGIDVTYVSKIENSRKPTPPSEQLIRQMAGVLGSSAEDLLALAGHFNRRELQRVASETPEVATLLRRIQSRQFSAEELRSLLRTMDAVRAH